MVFPSALALRSDRQSMAKLLRMAGHIHGEVVLTRIAPIGIFEFVYTIAGVINAVAFLQEVDFTIERQPKSAALDCNILPRAGIVRQKGSGVYAGGDSRPHELKLHIRE